MCMDHSLHCHCGMKSASFQFKDSLLPPEVITDLRCPICSTGVPFDSRFMLQDNGWVIAYNMEIARFMLNRIPAPEGGITPEFIFDEGYGTWRSVTPTDGIDSLREREQILQYAKTDPKRYFSELRAWGTDRMARLAQEGWRKAREVSASNSMQTAETIHS
jgi:hypothetical protein